MRLSPKPLLGIFRPLVMARVLLGHEVGFHDDADIGRIEVIVDYGAVADKAAKPADNLLINGGRAGKRPRRIENAARQAAHLDVAIRGEPAASAPGRRDDSGKDRIAGRPSCLGRCRADWRSQTSSRYCNGIHRPRSRSTIIVLPIADDKHCRRKNARVQGFRRDKQSAALCRIHRPNKTHRDAQRPRDGSSGRCRQRSRARFRGCDRAPADDRSARRSGRSRGAAVGLQSQRARQEPRRKRDNAAPAPHRYRLRSRPSELAADPSECRRSGFLAGALGAPAGGLPGVTTVPSITPRGRAQKTARCSCPPAVKAPRDSELPKTDCRRDLAYRSFHTAAILGAARNCVELEAMADEIESQAYQRRPPAAFQSLRYEIR